MQDEIKLGLWEKYLTLWVALSIVAGMLIGKTFPLLSQILAEFKVAQVSIPIAICLFFMIYPIMVQIDFKEVKKAIRSPKPVGLTLFMNWAVKPFTMALFAWFSLSVLFGQFLTPEQIQQYYAGMILLGVAPCTAMVLVWSYLARGNVAHTLVMTAINSLTMVILYAPLATFLLGISGIVVPWSTIALTVTIYIVTPLVAGYYTRKIAIERKGLGWFKKKLVPPLGKTAIAALLMTLVVLFSYQGHLLLAIPVIIGVITIGIFANILTVFAIPYIISRKIHLPYEEAAPVAIIAGSNHFEVAVAVAITLFGVQSGAALATVVGVLTEVPLMLFIVWLCKRTRSYFDSGLLNAPHTMNNWSHE
ncbi:MAG: ACR3 family arsenite efflux transporter [Candidatus Hadarchaeales archaeon]